MSNELDEVFGGVEEHHHFTMIPHVIDDLGVLTPYAFRLYIHICRVVGQGGKCWQSTETLAHACHMSVGAVVKAKRELAHTKVGGKPLIYIVPIPGLKPGSAYHNIYINDIWAANYDKYPKSNEKPPNPKSIPGILSKVHVVNHKVHVVT